MDCNRPNFFGEGFALAISAVMGRFLFLILTKGTGCVAVPLNLDDAVWSVVSKSGGPFHFAGVAGLCGAQVMSAGKNKIRSLS